MSDFSGVWLDRFQRLRSMCGPVSVGGSVCGSSTRLIGVTSSRLGHDPRLHARVCRFLRRSLLDCRHSGSELLVGRGSAIEPWARRAAELYGVRCRELHFNAAGPLSTCSAVAPQSTVAQPSLDCSVDAAMIALADQIDAVYVRRGGRVEKCLSSRLEIETSASIRVALIRTKNCAARQLMMAGAVGWFDPEIEPFIKNATCVRNRFAGLTIDDPIDPHWGETEGQWLIHCTRAPCGRWPGETERQYLDSMLLDSPSGFERTPLDSLLRILRMGRLIAGAKTSKRGYPVVCFSSRSLRDLLANRCFRSHVSRWDYEPYGIAIRIATAKQRGIKPVIYGNPSDREDLPEADQYRFHPRGSRYQWSEEREWRANRSVDLFAMDRRDLRVFALDNHESRRSLSRCPWTVSFLSSPSKISAREAPVGV